MLLLLLALSELPGCSRRAISYVNMMLASLL
jgi:hypothetical protein